MESVGDVSVLAFALSSNLRFAFATGAPLPRTCPEIEPTHDSEPSLAPLLLLSTAELLSPLVSVLDVSGTSVGAGVCVAVGVATALAVRVAGGRRVGVAGGGVLVAVIVGLAMVGAATGELSGRVGLAATRASVTPLSKVTSMLAGAETKASAICAAT